MECRFCTVNNNYLVFADGNIYSRYSQKMLRPRINSKGYLTVSLHENCKQKSYLVHRLVAEAFIPNIDHKLTVNHRNGNKFDNSVKNLEWATHLENNHRAVNTGLVDLHNQTTCKSVQMFTKAGEFVAEFRSVADASRYIGKTRYSIRSVCGKPNRTCGGYVWKFK